MQWIGRSARATAANANKASRAGAHAPSLAMLLSGVDERPLSKNVIFLPRQMDEFRLREIWPKIPSEHVGRLAPAPSCHETPAELGRHWGAIVLHS